MPIELEIIRRETLSGLQCVAELEPGHATQALQQQLRFGFDSDLIVSAEVRGDARLRAWKVSSLPGNHPCILVETDVVEAMARDETSEVIAAGMSGTLGFFRPGAQVPHRELQVGFGIHTFGPAADGCAAVVVGFSGEVALWRAGAPDAIQRLADWPEGLLLGASACSSTAGWVAATGRLPARREAYVCIWQTSTGRLTVLQVPEAISGRDLDFHPSEEALAIGTAGGLFIVDLPQMQLRSMRERVSWSVLSARYSPDGTLLAAAMPAPFFAILDPRSGNELWRHSDIEDERMSTAVFSPDGKLLAWRTPEGGVGLWGIPKQN